MKENVRKRPLDGPQGLGRQGAVRKRKDEVHEQNGHKFVSQQFYQLMLCAFCNDFLLNAVGYQCEDCRYTCHKKCYEKVVTKCISKSNTGVCLCFIVALSLLMSPLSLGRRRREDQPSYSPSVRASDQYWRQLVLSLWIHASPRPEECPQMLGM